MRNVICAIVAATAFLFGSALPVQAWGGYGGHYGHGGRHGYGGHSYGYGGYYGYPAYGRAYPYRPYSYSAPKVAEQQPTVYVQQQFYWYYCENAKGYYPSVQQCPGAWIRVVPPTGRPEQ